jgi:hypothetical protein
MTDFPHPLFDRVRRSLGESRDSRMLSLVQFVKYPLRLVDAGSSSRSNLRFGIQSCEKSHVGAQTTDTYIHLMCAAHTTA